jgi:hypothetical protein
VLLDLTIEGRRGVKVTGLLAPGDSVTVRYTFTFPDMTRGGCMLSPDHIGWIPVTYRRLGFRRTAQMPFKWAHLSTFTAPRCDEHLQPVPPS